VLVRPSPACSARLRSGLGWPRRFACSSLLEASCQRVKNSQLTQVADAASCQSLAHGADI
jgi:hypothetical protein